MGHLDQWLPAGGAAQSLLSRAVPDDVAAMRERTKRARRDAPPAAPLRLVVVHWKIKRGREAEFLDYWASTEAIPDRSGLVSEFLSSVADRDQAPWTTLRTLDPRWTSYFNVGLWRDAEAFEDQVGRHIDDTRPLLGFEAERRERVFLVPERWRRGHGQIPAADRLEAARTHGDLQAA